MRGEVSPLASVNKAGGNVAARKSNIHGGWRRLKSRSALTPKQSTEPPWYVIRMPGGVGGGGREAPPYPDYVICIEDVL